MIKKIAYVTTALALIALGIVVRDVFLGNAGGATQNEANEKDRATRASASSQVEYTRPSPNPSDEVNPSDNVTPADSGTLVPPITNSFGAEFQDSLSISVQGGGDGSQSLAHIGASNPDAVIGRPFPVSVSVEHSCQRDLAKWGKQATCSEVLERLSNMAQEPRDLIWAAETEAKLRDFLAAESDKFTIRAIECRLSLCAIEVASIYGPYLGLGYRAEVNTKLAQAFGMHGYEVDANSARVTVTLLMYERR